MTDLLPSERSKHVSIVVDHFERLSVEQQLQVAASLRARRERDREPSLVVLCGHWHPHLFSSRWRNDTNSPPFDKVNLVHVDGLRADEVSDEMEGQLRLVPPQVAQTLSEVVSLQTGGDREIVAKLLEFLEPNLPPESVQEITLTLDEQASVQEVVLDRLRGLSTDAERVLRRVLRHQVILLPADDLRTEELFVRGLLRPRGRVSTQRECPWVISSPVVAAVLYRSPLFDGRDAFRLPWPDQVIPLGQPVAVDAMRVVCEIENLLRNLLVLELASRYPDLPLLEALRSADASIATDVDRVRERDRGDGMLLKAPVTAFLELGALESLLTGKLYGDCFKAYFPDKATLTTDLGRFRAIRAAVAHNKTYSIEIVNRLNDLAKSFHRALGIAASQRLSFGDSGGVRLIVESIGLNRPQPNGPLVIKARVRYPDDGSQASVWLEARVVRAGNGPAISPVRLREMTSLKPGEVRTLSFALDTSGQAFEGADVEVWGVPCTPSDSTSVTAA